METKSRLFPITRNTVCKTLVVLSYLVLAAAGLDAQDFDGSAPIVSGLSCDGKGSSPDNVSTYTPMLSWTFSDSDAGDGQTAYQIRVWRDDKGLEVWDSGVRALATNTRMYAGNPLVANMQASSFLSRAPQDLTERDAVAGERASL